MNRSKLIAAAVIALAALAIITVAMPATPAGPFTWLAGTPLIAAVLLGVRLPQGRPAQIEVHPPAAAKQKVPRLGNNCYAGNTCYIGRQIQGNHEKHLTTICLA